MITAAATYTGGTASSYMISDTAPDINDTGWVGSASISTSDNLKRTDAGTYKVWTRITGDDNHNTYVWPTPLEVTITKADPTMDPWPTVNPASLTYNGNSQQLLTSPGTAVGGTIDTYTYHRYDEVTDSPTQGSTWYTYEQMSPYDAGYYYIYVYVLGDENHNDKILGPIPGSPKHIDKAAPVYTTGPIVSSWGVWGNSTLSCSDITTDMEYSTDSGATWTSVTSSGQITGLHLSSGDQVWIRVKADANHYPNQHSVLTYNG